MKQRLLRFAPYVFVVLAVVIFFYKIIFAGQTFFFSGLVFSDFFGSNYPSKVMVHQNLLRGNFPLWTDMISNGYPYFDEGGLAALYTLNQIAFRLPIPTMTAFNLVLLAQFVIAGVGTFLFLRTVVRLRTIASLFGALSYMFCGYMLMRIQHTNIVLIVSYFPLLLLSLERLLDLQNFKDLRKIIGALLFLSLMLATIFSIGSIEFGYYSVLFALVYYLIRLFVRRDSQKGIAVQLVVGLGCIVLMVLSVAPQLAATFSLLQNSDRQQGVGDIVGSEEPWPLSTFGLFFNSRQLPAFTEGLYYQVDGQNVNVKSVYVYLGILPIILFLSLPIVFLMKRRAIDKRYIPWVITFAGVLFIAMLYALGGSTQLYAVVRETIPLMKFFRIPLKIMFVIEFCIAVLAAISLQIVFDLMLKKFSAKNIQIAGVVSVCILFIDLFLNNSTVIPLAPANDWLSPPPFAEYIQKQQSGSFTNWRSYSQGTDIAGTDSVNNYALQRDLRNLLFQDLNMIYGVALNRGYTGLHLRRQDLLNGTAPQIDYAGEKIILPSKMLQSLSIQSVRYIFSDIPIEVSGLTLQKNYEYQQPYKHSVGVAGQTSRDSIEVHQAYLYENENYFSRVSLVAKNAAQLVKPADKDATNILNTVLAEGFDPRSSLIIESAEGQSEYVEAAREEKNAGTVQSMNYFPEDFSFAVNATEDAYLTLADTWYPGWKAFVDGNETRVERANYNFRAVFVPSGAHTLRFVYQPAWERFAWPALFVGLAIYIALSVVYVVLTRKSTV